MRQERKQQARRRTWSWLGILVLLGTLTGPGVGLAESLRGSRASLDRQNRVAREHDFTYLRTGARVKHFANKGWLVRIRPTRHFRLHAVSYPYARPEVRLFVRRLSAQYHSACGEPLVITSLTRPTTRQPRNASDRSVHPTGMAVDLRYSRNRSCRQWLERVLLDLERAGVLEATRERFPRHYHVALFPKPYASYVARLQQDPGGSAAKTLVAQGEEGPRHVVENGDSLWTIARRHGTTVRALRSLNALRGNRIFAGQVLALPSGD